MADELNETPESNPDQAALDAVANFFNESGREDAAAREAGVSAPVYGEAQQQADELEQEELSDPSNPDNEPAKPVNKETKTVTDPSKSTPEARETAPAVDDDLRTIAKEFGWSDEKIDRLVKADPELAKETFETFAATLAEQSRQFLPRDPGQSQPASQHQVQAAAAPAAKPQATAIPSELSDESLKKFAEENGEQAANLIKLIRDNFVVKQNALEDRLVRAEQAAQAQELKTVAAEANTVISGLAGKHPALYGTGDNVNALTVEQYNRRVELTQLADQIRTGAAAQNRNLSVSQALTHAHYILSRDAVKSEARKEVVAAVQKRAKQTTARPTARVNPEGKGFKRSDASAAEAYSRRMAELGIE